MKLVFDVFASVHQFQYITLNWQLATVAVCFCLLCVYYNQQKMFAEIMHFKLMIFAINDALNTFKLWVSVVSVITLVCASRWLVGFHHYAYAKAGVLSLHFGML